MPTLDEIRTALLLEHAQLRACIDEVRASTAKWRSDGAAFELPRACLDRLAEAFRAHNAAEEAALYTVLPTIDAWGPARNEVMVDVHVAEHREILATLLEAGGVDKEATAECIVALLDKMLAHMATEESAFLRADVLNDDLKVDSFGG